MPTELAVRYLLEILIATGTAAVFYGYSRRRPVLVAALASRFDRFAARRALLFVVAAALLPLVLRLAVLPWAPPRIPRIHDDFGHLLVADTLAHGRLANPPHPLAPHLETIYVLQHPAYVSIYPLGQGLILAVGTLITGMPWTGVLLGVALMGGAIAWMLFGVVPAGWAAIGGVLASVTLGVPHGWIDMFYGGALCAFGGALLFGALARLRDGPSAILGLTAGLGWGIVWLTRPYESLVPLVFTWVIVLIRARRERRWRTWAGTLALLGAAQLGVGGLTALHNLAVTGSFMTLPYVLNQRIYGVPQSPLGRPPVEATGLKTPEQAATYWTQRRNKERAEAARLGWVGTIVHRAASFFLRGWLYVPVLLGLAMLRDPVTVACTVLLVGALLTSSFYPSFFPHYWAAYGGVLFLLAIRGLMRLRQWQPTGRPIGPAIAAFLVVGMLASVVRGVPIAPILGISEYGDADTVRHKVLTRLSATPGQHVVFVRYGPTHGSGDEWVYNRADVDAARIVWCRAIGSEEDARVMSHYAGRRFWLAEVESTGARVRRLLPPGSPPASGDASTEEWVVTIKPRARLPTPVSP